MRSSAGLVRDLRNARLVSGGRGCIIITTTDGQWIDGAVCDLLSGAAAELGFEGPGWGGVVEAIVAGCWPDLLSGAIEAAEALGEQGEAEAAE
jgi:hypothetical protein